MTLFRKTLLRLGTIGVIAASLAQSAQADQILSFGQKASTNTITTTRVGSTTTISGSGIAITVTNYGNSLPTTPFDAYLTLTATNTNAAVLNGNFIEQLYAGSFAITANADGTGTNYLSGTFANTDFSGKNGGSAYSLDATAPPPSDLVFTSDLLTALDLPRSASFSFSNVLPPLSIAGSPLTVESNTAAVSGTFGGNVVPEPGTLAMAGFAILAIGGVSLRRKLRTRTSL